MKTQRIAIRVRVDQESSWQEAARRENRSLSNWIASVCDAASSGKYTIEKNWREGEEIPRVPYPQAAIDSLQSPQISSGYVQEVQHTKNIKFVKGKMVVKDPSKPASVKIEKVSRPEKPKGHPVKCSCVKCQQAKGWRG